MFTTASYSYEFIDPPHYCSYKKLTDCLNLTENKCIQATERANDFCSEKYNLEEKGFEETKLIMEQVGTCATDQFLAFSSITKQQFETCGPHYAEYHKTLVEFLTKDQKERDKRFFEEDDPLHNYYKNKPNKKVKQDK